MRIDPRTDKFRDFFSGLTGFAGLAGLALGEARMSIPSVQLEKGGPGFEDSNSKDSRIRCLQQERNIVRDDLRSHDLARADVEEGLN